MQRTGLRNEAFALLEDILDVLAGECLAGDGVINGAGDFVCPVDVGKSDDLIDVDAFVEAASTKLLVVVFGLRARSSGDAWRQGRARGRGRGARRTL